MDLYPPYQSRSDIMNLRGYMKEEKSKPNGTKGGMESFPLKLQKRLRFIEGQSRGIRTMAEEGRDLADIFVQLLAVQSAARAAAEMIVQEQVARKLKEAVQQTVRDCVEGCDLCDDVKALGEAIDQIDFASFFNTLTKFPRDRSLVDHE